MTWDKRIINIDNLDTFYNVYKQMIKKGDTKLEHLYCIFLVKDCNVIHIHSIFDFIDSCTAKTITKETLTKLYIYQPFN